MALGRPIALGSLRAADYPSGLPTGLTARTRHDPVAHPDIRIESGIVIMRYRREP